MPWPHEILAAQVEVLIVGGLEVTSFKGLGLPILKLT